LTPKIIVEPIVFDDLNIMDYKFFCYRGEPRMIQVDFDRRTAHTRSLLDIQWNTQSFGLKYPVSPRPAPRPARLPDMLQAAAKLSADFDFVRVDFYSRGEQFYVGEITNCHGGAVQRFVPPEAEEAASRLLFESSPRSAA
jgi:hypothetical protein